jgi:hypothetical protein
MHKILYFYLCPHSFILFIEIQEKIYIVIITLQVGGGEVVIGRLIVQYASRDCKIMTKQRLPYFKCIELLEIKGLIYFI